MSDRARHLHGPTGLGDRVPPLLVLLIAALLVSFATAGSAPAQTPLIPNQPNTTESKPATESAPSPRERIAATRTTVTEQLATARRELETATGTGETAATEPLRAEVEALERTLLFLDRQEAQLERSDELEATRTQLAAQLESLRKAGPSEARPDSFSLLEATRSELSTHVQRGDTVASAAAAAEKALDDAKNRSAQADRERRQAREALDSATDDEARARLSVPFRRAELRSLEAREELALREIERANQELARAVYDTRKNLLAEKVAWIEERVQFTSADLESQLERLALEESRVERELTRARADLEGASRRLSAARDRLARTAEADPSLAEEIEAERIARETEQARVTSLGEQLARFDKLESIWTRRFRLANDDAKREELVEWYDEAKELVDSLELEAKLQAAEASELRKQVAPLRQKAETTTQDAPVAARWIREQIRLLEYQIAIHEDHVASVDAARGLAAKLVDEIGSEAAAVPLLDRIAEVFSTIRRIWSYEITAVDDRSITVGKVAMGLLLLVLGVTIARMASGTIGRHFLPRLGVNEGAAAAIQTLLFYMLVLTLALLALRIVNVPLTAFTIIGGALAIGIGFGSQNIMNNFISGLILLVERPIRVGDLVETGDLLGIVEHIGPRSARIRRSDNVDIIVPNSVFLEQNVTNWTLSDDRYRALVRVGVAYGTNPREVTRLLDRAVDEHGKVLKRPEPIILFSNFGDNSLDFEVHFWIRMRRLMDRRIIESDIRHRIDGLFNEAGIVIAFPQRDVHIDSVGPLDVRLVRERAPENA